MGLNSKGELQPCPQLLGMVEVTESGKHSSVLQDGINYDRKMFYCTGRRSYIVLAEMGCSKTKKRETDFLPE
jgi:hypothetical protein